MGDDSWVPIRTEKPIPIHECMSKVVLKEFVVHVVVGRGAEPHKAEQGVPRVHVLCVDKRQPVRIEGAEGHIAPYIRMYHLSGDEKGQQDHHKSVGRRAVERVEKPRIREAVMRLVRGWVDGRFHAEDL
jgi:hypothetical protein